MSVVVRFAPSPTGLLHIGNARPALLNWLFALRHHGRFVLRLDDTDRQRSTPAFADAIGEDLAWLGIRPHGRVVQSERLALYEAAAARLKQAGRLYACYETADELERQRKRQIARGLPPIYDRAGLTLAPNERARLEAEGRRPHWRFRLDPGTIAFDDLVRGPVEVRADSMSDPVLVREDGSFLYTLPSVVDDADLGITHVIRGEDHVTNTGVQIQILQALGAAVPCFAHHNLLTTPGGEGLSKRSGALSLHSLRAEGYEPMAVASVAVLIGTSDRVEPVASLEALAARADLAHVSRAPAQFDPSDLVGVNAKLVHGLPHAAVAERLGAMGIGGGAAFWEAVRGNLTRVAEAAAWWEVVSGEEPFARPPGGEAQAWLAQAADLLPPEPWDAATWEAWTGALKARTGLKGKALFMPLRWALTGRDHGPEMKALLPLMGRARVRARLLAAAASGPSGAPTRES